MSERGRRRRRKLQAHDAGLNRHNKGLSRILKRSRQELERARLNMKKRPGQPGKNGGEDGGLTGRHSPSSPPSPLENIAVYRYYNGVLSGTCERAAGRRRARGQKCDGCDGKGYCKPLDLGTDAKCEVCDGTGRQGSSPGGTS